MVSDAGTPGISDPGTYVVNELRKQEIPIISIPGPCAITTLLSVSGLTASPFTFLGFFPKNEGHGLALLKKHEGSVVFFETAKRLLKTLTVIEKSERASLLVLGKELTKKFEKIWVESPKNCLALMTKEILKGEWVIGAQLKDIEMGYEDDLKIFMKHLSKKQILTIAKEKNWPKNDIYRILEKQND